MERVFDVLFSDFALLVLFLGPIVIILRCSGEVRLWATRVNMWRLQNTLAL